MTATGPRERTPEAAGMGRVGGKLPDFLMIGGAKCGTTTFHDYLARHPGLCMSPEKEPSFFSYRPDGEGFHGWRRMRALYRHACEAAGVEPEPLALDDSRAPDCPWDSALGWYRALFARAKDGQLCGESSTNYTRAPQYPGVPARIAGLLPSAKLLYLMRHPIDRAYSHYVHRHAKELHPGEPFRLTFEELVEREPVCLDSSDYMRQIDGYLAHFPRESFLFLFLKDFIRDPAGELRKALRFLGVEDVDLVGDDPILSNESAGHLEAMTASRATEPLRKFPLLAPAAKLVPESARRAVKGWLLRSPYGKAVERGFVPPPMKPETRAALVERFREPNRRLGEFLGLDLSSWDR